MSQGAFLATVPSRAAALLRDTERRRALTLPTQTSLAPTPASPTSHLAPAPVSHLHRAAVALLPRLHEAVPALRRVQELGGRGVVSRVWPGPCPSPAPTFLALRLVLYLEGLVEEAAPAALLKKLVVLVDAAARELAGQVEPGQG